jgi:hypothetical protein
MQRTNAKQSGFTIVEGLLIVVALVALVGGGWLVYQHTKQSATRTDAASNPNQSTQQTPASPAPTVAYLEIKEWSIKLPLSDSIKDAYYIPSSGNVDENGQTNVMWLSLRSLTSTACNPANNNKGDLGAIGSLMRITPGQTDGVTGELLTKEFPNGTTIGSYYYAYKSWATTQCAATADIKTPDAAFASAANGHVQATTATSTN